MCWPVDMEGDGGPEEDTHVSGLCRHHGHEQTFGTEKESSYFCLIHSSVITSPQFLYRSLLNHLFTRQRLFKCQMYIWHCSKHWVICKRRSLKDTKYWEFAISVLEKIFAPFFSQSTKYMLGLIICQVISQMSMYELVMRRREREEPSSHKQ